ncbi:MAG: hypothetical protein GQE15_17510 [Archangiaceae bacterium]|nr:hypothetical protein [Archangiaceae bacterium]
MHSVPVVHGFRQALVENPAPSRLGDVALRYEPSMLVGETSRATATWRPTALMVSGLALIVVAIMVLLTASNTVAFAVLSLSAASLAGSVLLARRERRKRGFVANFVTLRLRLDFTTPIAGRPATLWVPFDEVKAVTLLEQGDGLHCLTVDFSDGGSLLREVLVAFIPAPEIDAAARLARVLQGAFGLGSIPPDSPYLSTLSSEPPTPSASTPNDSGPG